MQSCELYPEQDFRQTEKEGGLYAYQEEGLAL
jgi:hypothetical protein